MAGRNSKTIGCRVDDNLKNRFDRESRMRGMNLCDVVEAFVIASENDDIDFADKRYYSKEPIEDYTDILQRKYERFIEKLTDKEYPKEVIGAMIDNMIDQVNDMGKYNPKRSKISDTGC